MFFRLSLVTLIFALLTLGTLVKGDMTKVFSDIQVIGKQLQELNQSIDAFASQQSMEKLIMIHDIATNIQYSLQTATDDTNACSPFTDPDATTLLARLENMLPIVRGVLANLVHHKFLFVDYNVTSLVRQDLEGLKNDTNIFYVALIDKSPADKKDYEENQKNAVDANFTNAINEFSG